MNDDQNDAVQTDQSIPMDPLPGDTPKRVTRRPRSLAEQLVDMRATQRNAVERLKQRASRLAGELNKTHDQLYRAEAELHRLNVAVGEARDNERGDIVDSTDLQHKGPVGRPHTLQELADRDLNPDNDPESAARGLNVARLNGQA